jgi:hypothetical protein
MGIIGAPFLAKGRFIISREAKHCIHESLTKDRGKNTMRVHRMQLHLAKFCTLAAHCRPSAW